MLRSKAEINPKSTVSDYPIEKNKKHIWNVTHTHPESLASVSSMNLSNLVNEPLKRVN